LLLVGAVLTLALFFLPIPTKGNVEQLSYSQLKSDISGGQVASVAIGPDGSITGTLSNGTKFASSYPVNLQDPQFAQLLDQHNIQVTTQPSQTSISSVLLSLLPLLLVVALFWWTGRAARRQLAGLGGIGRARGKVFDLQRPSTTFADVAGYEGAKQEVTEVVDFLKHPDRYLLAGAVGPKGVLMVGPPGTGKTLLARAVAGEAGVPFISVTGSSFIEMFVGVGAARVRDLFADARRRAPSIVFIDEIDAIGQRRGGQVISSDERDQTLNQLLAEMDGFDAATGVVVMAATNRPEVLDPALLRPGRFDRQVVIPLPARDERRAILAVHSRGKPLSPNLDLDVVARATPGFSGADLANLVNEAAIFAVRASRQIIESGDFAEARDRILLGRRDSSNALLPDEKRSVSVHEAGHAPVAKVTILPAGQALGDRAAARRRSASVLRGLPKGLAGNPDGRASCRKGCLRADLDRRRERSGRRHGARHAYGARVRHESGAWPDRVRHRRPDLSRRSGVQPPALRGGHSAGDRRGGRQAVARSRGTRPRHFD
jgi:cell division protease FtsH